MQDTHRHSRLIEVDWQQTKPDSPNNVITLCGKIMNVTRNPKNLGTTRYVSGAENANRDRRPTGTCISVAPINDCVTSQFYGQSCLASNSILKNRPRLPLRKFQELAHLFWDLLLTEFIIQRPNSTLPH
jgi:hypothetical protein